MTWVPYKIRLYTIRTAIGVMVNLKSIEKPRNFRFNLTRVCMKNSEFKKKNR